jgi:hypothetical protein
MQFYLQNCGSRSEHSATCKLIFIIAINYVMQYSRTVKMEDNSVKLWREMMLPGMLCALYWTSKRECPPDCQHLNFRKLTTLPEMISYSDWHNFFSWNTWLQMQSNDHGKKGLCSHAMHDFISTYIYTYIFLVLLTLENDNFSFWIIQVDFFITSQFWE